MLKPNQLDVRNIIPSVTNIGVNVGIPLIKKISIRPEKVGTLNCSRDSYVDIAVNMKE